MYENYELADTFIIGLVYNKINIREKLTTHKYLFKNQLIIKGIAHQAYMLVNLFFIFRCMIICRKTCQNGWVGGVVGCGLGHFPLVLLQVGPLWVGFILGQVMPLIRSV